ncbi:MAG: hypothetical protein IPF66_13885 [Holophagales bacterium]|nr:hypothetical protein [Holophagales bacterium]
MPWQRWLGRTSTFHSSRRTTPSARNRGEGIPATTLVREAIEGWIDDQKAKRLRDEIAAYALEMAGTSADLDPELEAAAAAELKAAAERK